MKSRTYSGSAFSLVSYERRFALDSTPSAGYEMHDQRNHCEDKQDVNEEAADVEHKKSAEPEQNQNDREN
jgi:hypothetical protein